MASSRRSAALWLVAVMILLEQADGKPWSIPDKYRNIDHDITFEGTVSGMCERGGMCSGMLCVFT